MHENYSKAGLLDKLKALALKRCVFETVAVCEALAAIRASNIRIVDSLNALAIQIQRQKSTLGPIP